MKAKTKVHSGQQDSSPQVQQELECIQCGRPSTTYLCTTCTSMSAEEAIERDSTKPRAILTRDKIKDFVLGGNSTFTLYNEKKDTHLTFKVRVEKNNKDLFFVSVLTGPDNWINYTYLGIIRDGVYWHGKKSTISKDSPSAKAFEWFWSNIDRLPPALSVLHEGKCGKCGRKLTVPESIESGFGPECSKFLTQ